MQYKSILVTDLDNTLFDWVNIWHSSFRAMLDEIKNITGFTEEVLLPEISAVHQRHGTSEYSFMLGEVECLAKYCQGRDPTIVFGRAIEAYRYQRRQNLKLYPHVAETLLKIKGAGSLIVAYTESMAFYSNYRLRRLGLDGVIDHVFCPKDHELPKGLTPDQVRKYPSHHYQFKYTVQDHTPEGTKKPDSKVLKSIIEQIRGDIDQCVYIGDSLMKDVAMAQDCNVSDVWAQYGQADTREEYDLLRAVTHWTKNDVERERRISERPHVVPSHVAKDCFSEILGMFKFVPIK